MSHDQRTFALAIAALAIEAGVTSEELPHITMVEFVVRVMMARRRATEARAIVAQAVQ